jgi:dGTPase
VEELLDGIDCNEVRRTLSRQIGDFVTNCRIIARNNFMSKISNRYRFSLEISPDILEQERVYKNLAKDLVFDSPTFHQLDKKQSQMLKRIFSSMKKFYITKSNRIDDEQLSDLIPTDTKEALASESNEDGRARIICDYISGMTDAFLIRFYRKLFESDFGSLVDLI